MANWLRRARLQAALKRGEPISAEWVSMVAVKSGIRTSWHLVDSEVVFAAGLDPASSPFVLHDRDRESQASNDRPLILKLLPSASNHPRVCKLCLAAAVVPADAERLRRPLDEK